MSGILLTRATSPTVGVHIKQTVNNVTTSTLVDNVVTTAIEWNVRCVESLNSSNVEAAKIFAVHNGSQVDFSIFSIIRVGVPIPNLTYNVILSGGNTLELYVSSDNAVDVDTRRASIM